MAVLLMPQRPAGQVPAVGVQLARDHPLALGLVRCWLLREGAGVPVDLVHGRRTVVNSGGGTWTTRQPGRFPASPTLELAGGSQDGYKVQDGPIIGGRLNWTLAGWCRIDTGPLDAKTIYGERYSAGNAIAKLCVRGSFFTEGELTYRNDAGTLTQLRTVARHLDVPRFFVGTKRGTALRIYIDGTLENSATFGSSSDAFSSSAVSVIGYDDNVANTSWDGHLGPIYVYDRALSPAEVLWLYHEPWAMLQPLAPAQRYWLPPLQITTPASDITDGTWTNEGGTNTDLYASIDEATVSDSDYIQSTTDPSSDAATVGLGGVSDPQVSTGHYVRYRIRRA